MPLEAAPRGDADNVSQAASVSLASKPGAIMDSGLSSFVAYVTAGAPLGSSFATGIVIGVLVGVGV